VTTEEIYVVKEAWVEIVPVYGEICTAVCNQCGEDITGKEKAHLDESIDKLIAGEITEKELCVTYTSTPTGEFITINKEIYHEAEYGTRTVVAVEAWTEEVITYECSGCGLIKWD